MALVARRPCEVPALAGPGQGKARPALTTELAYRLNCVWALLYRAIPDGNQRSRAMNLRMTERR